MGDSCAAQLSCDQIQPIDAICSSSLHQELLPSRSESNIGCEKSGKLNICGAGEVPADYAFSITRSPTQPYFPDPFGRGTLNLYPGSGTMPSRRPLIHTWLGGQLGSERHIWLLACIEKRTGSSYKPRLRGSLRHLWHHNTDMERNPHSFLLPRLGGWWGPTGHTLGDRPC